MIQTKELMTIVLSGEPPVTTQKNNIRFNRRTCAVYHTKDFVKVRDRIIEQLTPFIPRQPYDGVLALTLRCYWTPPKSHKEATGWRNTKPDGDNSIAVIADQLEKLGFVKNDSRFAIEHVEKHYDATNPRIEIELKEIIEVL